MSKKFDFLYEQELYAVAAAYIMRNMPEQLTCNTGLKKKMFVYNSFVLAAIALLEQDLYCHPMRAGTWARLARCHVLVSLKTAIMLFDIFVFS